MMITQLETMSLVGIRIILKFSRDKDHLSATRHTYIIIFGDGDVGMACLQMLEPLSSRDQLNREKSEQKRVRV